MTTSNIEYQKLANVVRGLCLDCIESASSGHIGLPLGMADVVTVLFARYLRFSPSCSSWLGRDRFILSAGHGSSLLYAMLYVLGYSDIDIADLQNFRRLGGKCAGHPEEELLGGIEATTGPLGQGLGNGIGIALGGELLDSYVGDNLVSHNTYILAGDGCLMEGVSHEVLSLAGHLGLSKLCLLYDDNRITIDGTTDLADSEDIDSRMRGYGWEVRSLDGHNYQEIEKGLSWSLEIDKPVMLRCRTLIGYGSEKHGGCASAHGASFDKQETLAVKRRLGISPTPWDIDTNILNTWRQIGSRGDKLYEEWLERSKTSTRYNELLANLESLGSGFGTSKLRQSLQELLESSGKDCATRAASGAVIEKLLSKEKLIIGGSADLSDSNNTKGSSHKVLKRNNYDGNYLHYGVREHGMGAVMNGLALHSRGLKRNSLIVYGGTFLVFSDYLRPSIRLAALMKLGVIYVFTHDSIGLGEDGPTHQPIEHLSSLRAIPELLVLRPSDWREVIESWIIALENTHRPVVLALSRQSLPQLSRQQLSPTEVLSKQGAYVIHQEASTDNLTVCLLASGSELSLAMAVSEELEKTYNLCVRVVSVPCLELFAEQDDNYRLSTLGTDCLHVAIEAGVAMSWNSLLDKQDLFIGLDSFGLSGKASDLFRHFGLYKENIVSRILTKLNISHKTQGE